MAMTTKDFSNENLEGGNFIQENLENAPLRGANLQYANLYGANLKGADLTNTDLRRASFVNADLRGALLENANLKDADFTRADLTNACLIGANLTHTILKGANLTGARLSPFQIVPKVGQFRAFKKVAAELYTGNYILYTGNYIHVVLELLIPRSAQRTGTPVGRKCRASKVKVVGVVNPDPRLSHITRFHSLHDRSFTYEVGKWIKPVGEYDGDIRVECTHGIHFFMTYEEAAEYVY